MKLLVFCVVLALVSTSCQARKECLGSAGYIWCEKEGKCVRPWELAAERNIPNTLEAIDNLCNGVALPVGADVDEHSCQTTAGYIWCAAENACVRPWLLTAQNNIENTIEAFDKYCNGFKAGDRRDEHGCVPSAGYTWCESELRCVRPWELAKERDLGGKSVAEYCTPSLIGGKKDEHNCVASAGYTWCQKENACVRPWELARLKNIESTLEAFQAYCNPKNGGDRDVHGCIATAGYRWCIKENACVRNWEVAKRLGLALEDVDTYCNAVNSKDSHGCIATAGYMWCERERTCVRKWELADRLGIDRDQVDAYCASAARPKPRRDEDDHKCIGGAGYVWCEVEHACVRLWELAKARGMDVADVTQYCQGNLRAVAGNDHGCLASAGYMWCEPEAKCVRVWELAKEREMEVEDAAEYCKTARRGSDHDDHGCIASAGYRWCEPEAKCVRVWELAAEREMELEDAVEYCKASRRHVGGERDEHGCIASAGYRWCEPEAKCVRVWELAKEREVELEEIIEYCTPKKPGSSHDEHGCIASAGYRWCEPEAKCVRVWELAAEREMEVEEAVEYCKAARRGSDHDDHECIASAGYRWCEPEAKCVRVWELAKEREMELEDAAEYCKASRRHVGGERDEHGCIASAGYMWCEAENSCVKPWELAKLHEIELSEESITAFCARHVDA